MSRMHSLAREFTLLPHLTEVDMIGRYLSTTTLVVFGLLVSAGEASTQGFEAEYESLVDRFPASLDDEIAVDGLVEEVGDLTDRIRQHRRDNRDSLSDEELDRLRDLASEVRAFESVARVVGQIHNAADVSIESFEAVRERLGLQLQVLLTHESGLELIRVEVGSFVSLLLRNPTQTTFAVTYGVNDPEQPGGVGNAFCEKYSVMSGLFNSRDRELEGLEFITLGVRPSRAGRCD